MVGLLPYRVGVVYTEVWEKKRIYVCCNTEMVLLKCDIYYKISIVTHSKIQFLNRIRCLKEVTDFSKEVRENRFSPRFRYCLVT